MTGKLVIGLVTAGLFLAGFGGAGLPASAEPQHFLLKLANGTSIPYTGEPGTAPSSITVAGVAIPVVSVQDLGAIVQQVTPTVATPPPPPTPTVPAAPATPPPTTTTSPKTTTPSSAPQKQSAPSPSSSSPSPSKPAATPKQKKSSSTAKAPSAGKQTPQKTTAQKTTGKKSSKSHPKVEASKKPSKKTKPAKAHKKTTDSTAAAPPPAAHTPPAPTNPSFSLAQPGASPIGVPNFFIDKFKIPPFLLPIYQADGMQYGIRWEVLAAINEIETDYGRNLNVSSAGAVGWMQFMPATWKMYGVDANRDGIKDPINPVDAIFAAARYLKAAGGDTDIRRAVFAYNHADWYVDSVLMRAQVVSGLPGDLVGSLTGLTQGRFPVHAKATYAGQLTKKGNKVKTGNAAMVVESDTARRGIDIFSKPNAAIIAANDGKVVKIGKTKRLGHF